MVTPEELASHIHDLLLAEIEQGNLALEPADLPETVKVERPRNRDHGDWASNIAMQLAKKAGMNPRDFAQILVSDLNELEGIDSAEIAGPGFINIRLAAASAGELARTIVEAGGAFGRGESMKGLHINLEYVSANPTGPVHLGGARWAAVGDSLARLMKASGAKVTREYYFNDHGSQIDRFARSLYARAMGHEAPEDGYGGQYIADIAAQVREDAVAAGEPDPVTLPEEEAVEAFRARGVELMFDEIKQRLRDFRSEFDVFFHEDSLHNSGAVDAAIETLRQRGEVFDQDGAVWLRTTSYGDDKDRVLIKSDGQAAYFAGDVAYYLDKRRRGADVAIYLLGADHHGYISRLRAAAAAMGYNPNNVEVLIGQLVNLVRDGEAVRMSKRAGTIITLDDLVEAIGIDAARYSLVRSSVDSTLDIDLTLWANQSNENPVYYVQYAHARLCSLAKKAAAVGVTAGNPDLSLLTEDHEGTLIRTLGEYPTVVKAAAELREPHRIARYIEELAGTFHRFYDTCQILPKAGEQAQPIHTARLALATATRQVIANALGLLGVTAPEQM